MRALLLAFALAGPAGAQESAQFLKLGVGARALGMGGAYTAVADDASSAGWNPSGMAAMTKSELGLTHAELVGGTRYDYAGFVQPSKYGAFGAAGVHLSQPSLESRDASGRQTGGFSASDSAVAFSYASKLSGPFMLGGSVKYIQSTLGRDSANTVAADFGARYALAAAGPGVPLVGFAVQNVGRGLSFAGERTPLPLTLAFGAGYRLPAGIIFAADIKQRPHSRETEASFGTEYALLPSFSLRAGYGSSRAVNNAAGGMAALGGMAGGFGVKMLSYTLDYSITPFGALGNAQRFSLGARF